MWTTFYCDSESQRRRISTLEEKTRKSSVKHNTGLFIHCCGCIAVKKNLRCTDNSQKRTLSQMQVMLMRSVYLPTRSIVAPYKNCVSLTILILEKLRSPSSVKLGVPSSMNERSVRYMPRYGMQGGSQRCKASRKFRKRPSDETMFCSFSIVCFVWRDKKRERSMCVCIL